MIYIICIIKQNSKKVTSYRIFDTCSNSAMCVTAEQLKYIIINSKLHVINASIQNGNILTANWKHGYAVETTHSTEDSRSTEFEGPEMIILANNGESYKIVNSEGGLYNVSTEELMNYGQSEKIANCYTENRARRLYKLLKNKIIDIEEAEDSSHIIDYQGSKLRAVDIYTIREDLEFKQAIELKYKKFEAKAALLGRASITFKYEIENEEVRLVNYTGTNKDVILPNFITAIAAGAFNTKDIETIHLNEGLKVIGEMAFAGNDLKHIEIPSTVEFIGEDAFRFNGDLLVTRHEINENNFKLLNSNTLLLGYNAIYR